MSYPKQIKTRRKIEALTGIKSSLDKIRSVIALVYLLYVANERKSFVKYSVSMGSKISIEPKLLESIETIIGHKGLGPIINNNPLITNQYEPLYVGVTLLMKMGYLKMEGKQNTAERTGGVRFPKQLYFANNTLVLDLILKGIPEVVRYSSLFEWLQNKKASNSDFEERICMFLSTCTVFTQFKLRDNNKNELFFQTEGIYTALSEGNNDVIYNDSHEFVGPTRIYNNILKEGLEPWIKINNSTLSFTGKNNPDAESMGAMISTTLDIHSVSNDSHIDDDYIEDSETDNNNEPSLDSNSTSLQSLYRPFVTAIKSKPFLLLAGISGTGKSRIVRELARACWDEGSEEYESQKPRNFEMVQVKPNWHDSSELIGYVSRIGIDKNGEPKPVFVAGEFLRFVARAWEEPEVPYFLCLDEMNLAPVEQYFAEYLSVIESRKADSEGKVTTDPILKSNEQWYFDLTASLTEDEETRLRFNEDGICIPQNLIVIGTVNMDETTFSFSRKVLDRAMTIEMNEVDLEGGLENQYESIGKLGAGELIGTAVEGKDIYSKNREVCDTVIKYLQSINDKLEGTPFKIAYRTRNEALLYVVNNLPYNQIEGDDDNIYIEPFVVARALDEITNMKILSRIEGDETKVSMKFLETLEEAIHASLEEAFDGIFEEDKKYTSISLAKLDEMKKRLSSGYTSFWS